MALPAALVDYEAQKRINELHHRVNYLEDWLKYFIKRDENLKDDEKYLETLERRVQVLEKALRLRK